MVNKKQKYLLIAVAVIWTIIILFPPFKMVAQEGINLNRGFHFILSSEDNPAIVNIALLFMEWLFVLSIGICGWLLFRDKS